MSSMTPQEIVHELDKHIVGQTRAKRAVAIALRNRWRRQQVAEPLRQEITPKNILMIGPTGVGKTEIARRLARLADAPFIKVEATKFTEVGYVGRDVNTIVRDLVEISVKQTREQAMKRVRTRAQEAAEERILDALIPTARGVGFQEANAEQNGIVFLDEIDKITSRSEMQGADVSRQGVQRDLLPLVEGTTVSTRYGMVKTDHILFIASGAFHLAKPSDLIPELQGRFPIRVELDPLTVEDFERILTSTDASQVKQYQALLETEGMKIEFRPDAVRRLAEIAWQVNEKTENIGARRLYTVLEKLLEEISFEAGKRGPGEITIDAAYVDARLGELAKNEDLARYVL